MEGIGGSAKETLGFRCSHHVQDGPSGTGAGSPGTLGILIGAVPSVIGRSADRSIGCIEQHPCKWKERTSILLSHGFVATVQSQPISSNAAQPAADADQNEYPRSFVSWDTITLITDHAHDDIDARFSIQGMW